jgi:hypothetical protein
MKLNIQKFAVPEITGTGEVLRKMMVTYVNVGTSEAKVWEAQGIKTEESSLELNPDISTITDILGITYTDVNKMEVSQSIDPNTLRMGAKLSEIMLDIYRRGALAEYSQFEVLIVYGFLGTAGAYEADLETGCTIIPNSIGGSSRVDMPFVINLSGNKTLGTVNALYPAETIVFTEAVSA